MTKAATSEAVGAGATADAAVLRRSRDACRRVVRERARNFYYGLRLTPEPKRSAVYAVYAWMRAADDIADDEGGATPDERVELLDAFERRTRSVFDRGEADAVASDASAWWDAFRDAVSTYALEFEDFERVLASLRVDLEADGRELSSPGGGPVVMFETVEALERYCAGVASAVGVICVRIWGWERWADWETVRSLACRRGLAFQFTNVLRDVADDAAANRCYVPRELLEAHGVTPRELAGWSSPVACAGLVSELAQEASAHYDASAELERMVRKEGTATLWAMTRIYRGVLARVEQDPSIVARPGAARLSGVRKTGIALSALVRAAAGSW